MNSTPFKCESHEVFIYDKGGRQRLHKIDGVETVQWNRVRDDISTADILIRPTINDDFLSLLRPWRHEMVLFRNGRRVWEGPLTLLDFNKGYVGLSAKDILYWSRRTIIKNLYASRRPPLKAVRLMEMLFRREMAIHEQLSPQLNLLPNLTIIDEPDTVTTTREIEPGKSYVWEELDEMAYRAGIDYTVVGRQVFIFDTHDEIGLVRKMTDTDFPDGVRVVLYGAELATASGVTDLHEGFEMVGGPDDYYGNIELLHTAYGVPDVPTEDWEPPTPAELLSQAERNFRGRYPLPLKVDVGENAALNPNTADELMEQFVPGTRIPLVASGLFPIVQMQKLSSLRAEESRLGNTVKITMSPSTALDDSMEML